jgi:L-iditol 2-dehydrogenase
LTIAELPLPDIGEDDVLVRVRACGICGSDVHGFDGSSGRRIPPLVMGHEAAGTIERVGGRVPNLAPGMRVTFDSTVSCGSCEYCSGGQVNLCDARRVLGVSCAEYRRDGAFAEFIAVPARIVYPLPDGMPFEHAAMIEAVSVAVHAVNRSTPNPRGHVVVIGCGMIGLLVIQVLRARGCSRVMAVDVEASRLSLALRLGATDAVDTSADEIAEHVARATRQRGADHVFEAVGRAETVDMAVRCVRKGGTVTLIGNLAPTVPMPLQAVVTREISLLGSCASSGEYPACIDLMVSGAINVAPLISATAPLDEGPAWFDRLRRGGYGLMKVVLTP